jgi:predicted nucleic acid-binding protein
MSEVILVDSGVLVALLSRNDQFHNLAIATLSRLRSPLLTCEAVITETCFLLSRNSQSHQQVFTLLERGAVNLSFNLSEEFQVVSALMTKYQTVPMSLADACLVRMAEIYPRSQVLTLDSDFQVYRINRNQIIPKITLE